MLAAPGWEWGDGAEGCCPCMGENVLTRGCWGGQTCQLGQGKRINDLGLCY